MGAEPALGPRRAELREYEKVYPFGWLGVLSRMKPVSSELDRTASGDTLRLSIARLISRKCVARERPPPGTKRRRRTTEVAQILGIVARTFVIGILPLHDLPRLNAGRRQPSLARGQCADADNDGCVRIEILDCFRGAKPTRATRAIDEDLTN